MDGYRRFQAAVIQRSLVAAVIAGGLLAATHQRLYIEALAAGAVIGVAAIFHVGISFTRLTKRPKAHLFLYIGESLLRVLIAGAAPVWLIGRGPLLAYLIYIVGFVIPLAVLAVVVRQQMYSDHRATTQA